MISIRGLSLAAAVVVGLVACSSKHPLGTMTGAGGGGGAAIGGSNGLAGAGGVSATGGAGPGGAAGDAVAGAGGGAVGGAGGGAVGGAGAGIGHCDSVSGAGGAGGAAIPTGCNLDAARQALAALGIGTVGDPSASTMTLPANLATDAQWGVKSDVCREGGYDLTPLAGMSVCLVSQVMTGMCQGNPARVWVLMSNGAVQCIYKALCPGSRLAPGVYSTVDPLCGP
jgi:hypothetical protein